MDNPIIQINIYLLISFNPFFYYAFHKLKKLEESTVLSLIEKQITLFYYTH